MTSAQKRKFQKLCREIAALHQEIRLEHPDAEIYLEDGNISIYDWDQNTETRPYEPLCDGGYWPNSGGGGR